MSDGCVVTFVVILLFFRNLRWNGLIFLLLLASGGHRYVDWLVLPSVGRSSGIVIIWNAKSWRWLTLRLGHMLFVVS